jgi:hypothetical protein
MFIMGACFEFRQRFLAGNGPKKEGAPIGARRKKEHSSIKVWKGKRKECVC